MRSDRSIKGRGTATQPAGRFESRTVHAEDDGWFPDDEGGPVRQQTLVTEEHARSIISRNNSPDVPFTQSLNPFRGCEHGCSYCFARPTHSYLNLSPGLDFETRLFAKINAAELLAAELSKPGYVCSPITIGANTDPYQPIERQYGITRSVLEVLAKARHPASIITKNALVERDIDILSEMAKRKLVHVFVSVTTLDNKLSSKLEPRATAPHRRIEAIRRLSDAGIPVGVLVAPIIPMITDKFLEEILERAHDAGAVSSGYVFIRLPHEVKDIFRDWLLAHFPERAEHVMSIILQSRGGRDYDSSFGSRMVGQGVFAEMIAKRFDLAYRKFGYSARRDVTLDTSLFAPPQRESPQGSLF
jgi:DNA repair photolyase